MSELTEKPKTTLVEVPPMSEMTLLDYFAGLFLQRLDAADVNTAARKGEMSRGQAAAYLSYAQSEEMLKERKRRMDAGINVQPNPSN